MVSFLASRLLQAGLSLVVASMAIFGLARLSGDPAEIMLGNEASNEALQGDFGDSLRTRQPASEIVIFHLVNSLKLVTVAMAITLVFSVPIGVLAAVKRGTSWDWIARGSAVLGQSLPHFWVGIMSIFLFSATLGWLPSSGMGGWRTYILPAAV